jgi:hypothetical protein
MNNNDNGLDELLDLLKKNPRLVKEIVFNPEIVMSMLGSKAARRLVKGVDATVLVDATTFLKYVAGPIDGYPIAHCFKRTVVLCAKGTKYGVKCAGGTKPTVR